MRFRLLVLIAAATLLLAAGSGVSAQHSLRPTGYNIRYAESIDRDLMLDVYEPGAGTPPYPFVVMFHGSPGNKGDFLNNGIPQVVLNAGYVAVAVGYTTTLPVAYWDAYCAIGWIYANADQYHLDTSRIAVLGASYGGLVAAELGAVDDPSLFAGDCPNPLPDDFALRGVITDAGVLLPTLDELIGSPIDPPEELGDISADALAQIEATLRATPTDEWRSLDLPDSVHSYLQNFPLYWVDGGEPPHLLIHGIGDTHVPYQESLDYAGVLLAHGVNVMTVFDRLSGHVPAPRVYDAEMTTFLNRIFG